MYQDNCANQEEVFEQANEEGNYDNIDYGEEGGQENLLDDNQYEGQEEY